MILDLKPKNIIIIVLGWILLSIWISDSSFEMRTPFHDMGGKLTLEKNTKTNSKFEMNENQKAKMHSLNMKIYKFFEQKITESENFIYSPYSCLQILRFLINASNGRTRDQLVAIIGLDNNEEELLHRISKVLKKILISFDKYGIISLDTKYLIKKEEKEYHLVVNTFIIFVK